MYEFILLQTFPYWVLGPPCFTHSVTDDIDLIGPTLCPSSNSRAGNIGSSNEMAQNLSELLLTELCQT